MYLIPSFMQNILVLLTLSETALVEWYNLEVTAQNVYNLKS